LLIQDAKNKGPWIILAISRAMDRLPEIYNYVLPDADRKMVLTLAQPYSIESAPDMAHMAWVSGAILDQFRSGLVLKTEQEKDFRLAIGQGLRMLIEAESSLFVSFSQLG
jgi:hypothetical protein